MRRRVGRRLDAEHPAQRHRVERRPDLGVVVEIDVDVPPAGAPRAELPGPAAQGRRRVAAGVELLVAVQARVGEIRGRLLEQRPFPRGVGRDEGHARLAEEREKARVAEGLVTDLERVAQRPVRAGLELAAPVDDRIVHARQLGRGARAARQEPEETTQPLRIEMKARRQLPKDGPQLVSQAEQPVGEEVGEGDLHVLEPLDVRDEARRLDREDEAVGRLLAPRGVGLRALKGIERAVDLERRQPARRVGELAGAREPPRVESPAPAVVGPAGDADPDLARHIRSLAPAPRDAA